MIKTALEVGREYTNGHIVVRVVRIRDHAGTVKVWYRRADGKPITYDVMESWEYDANFRTKFIPQ